MVMLWEAQDSLCGKYMRLIRPIGFGQILVSIPIKECNG